MKEYLMPTTVTIIDDYRLFQEALVALIQRWTDFQVLYVAANGRDLLAQIEQNDHVPDLALVDLHMPEMDGFETTAQLRDLYPTTRVLIFSISDLEQDIAESVCNGAKGYLVKAGQPNEIRQAINDVMIKGHSFSAFFDGVPVRH